MKKLLLVTFLALAITPLAHTNDLLPYEDLMTEKQQEYLRYNGVSVHITKVDDRLISRRARAYYEVSLTNPYARAIRCGVKIISSRGQNEKYEVIDSKTHLGVYVAPKGITKMSGSIEIKHGRGDDGLQWIESKGHLIRTENCIFL